MYARSGADDDDCGDKAGIKVTDVVGCCVCDFVDKCD